MSDIISVIAYFSGWGMIYIHKIVLSTGQNKMVGVKWFRGTEKILHTSKMYQTAKGYSYFIAYGHRIYYKDLIMEHSGGNGHKQSDYIKVEDADYGGN